MLLSSFEKETSGQAVAENDAENNHYKNYASNNYQSRLHNSKTYRVRWGYYDSGAIIYKFASNCLKAFFHPLIINFQDLYKLTIFSLLPKVSLTID